MYFYAPRFFLNNILFIYFFIAFAFIARAAPVGALGFRIFMHSKHRGPLPPMRRAPQALFFRTEKGEIKKKQ